MSVGELRRDMSECDNVIDYENQMREAKLIPAVLFFFFFHPDR